MPRFAALAAGVCALCVVMNLGRSSVVALAAQQPTFRSSVDLIAVDVQVIDHDGKPLAGLTPADFEVSFKGKTRRVASADLIRYDKTGTNSNALPVPAAPILATMTATESAASRLVLIAIDATSFNTSDSRGAAVAAQGFVKLLPPTARVGLYTFPTGPRVDPTTEHFKVTSALDKVTGQQRALADGKFRIGASDIIDVTARDDAATKRVELQNCSPSDLGFLACVADLHGEIDGDALFLESQAIATLQTFGSVLETMEKIQGRKIVILVSAGIPTSDRQGGRPDLGDLPLQLGERAAKANATVYTLFLDHGYLARNSAEMQEGRVKNGLSNFARDDRDDALQGRWLDAFAGAAGGGFMRVQVGSGESSYDRILSETSAYYLLGVEPAESDRDGKSHELKVKVTRKGATVRSRAWAVIPKRGG